MERRARRRQPMSQVKEVLPVSPVKRRRFENPRNSSHMNVETLGEEQLVERRGRRSQPMSKVKESLPVSPVKRRKVGNPRNPSRKNVEFRPIPHPPPQPPPYVQPTANSKANVCYSCLHRFPSYEALEYHQNLKIRALKKCKNA